MADKKTITKPVRKTEKAEAATVKAAKPKATPKPDAKTARNALSVPVYSLAGRAAGTLDLPKELFGAKVNSNLLAQAIRVYLTNQKTHWSSTKTRGEVTASTRKIYKQKGTGRARHGAISAPIFVGGGVALGPKARKTILDLPKKMKKAALISALSQRASETAVFGVTGLEKSSGKTKEIASFISKIKDQRSKSLLIVADKNMENVFRSVRNLKNVDFLPADQINVLEVIKHQSVILTREAVEKLQERISKK
ncbi:50S ribosomal protein L4 [Candidatus Daviesbacteria bacterium]|nr:50S ribosomal protein L4 [Candidatus Daviesbacteria bacterium]